MIHKPLLRSIPPEQAKTISPWPDRLSGKTHFQKTSRSEEEVKIEYRMWYESLARQFREFIGRIPKEDLHPGHILGFYDELRRSNNKKLCKETEIYGKIDAQSYLVSFGEELFATDLNLIEPFCRQFFVERVAQIRSEIPFDQLLEIGCGSGVNLANFLIKLPLSAVMGLELNPDGVRFLEEMAKTLRLRATFQCGSLLDIWTIQSISPKKGAWALLSSSSFEQIPYVPNEWILGICSLPNRPSVVIQFEPLLFEGKSEFERACREYARINMYNTNLLTLLRQSESEGKIRILDIEKMAIGVSAYNPTSLVVWQPL